jgi:hypothetical protein
LDKPIGSLVSGAFTWIRFLLKYGT